MRARKLLLLSVDFNEYDANEIINCYVWSLQLPLVYFCFIRLFILYYTHDFIKNK